MTQPCPFCSLSLDNVVASSTHSLAIRDAYPVSEGHSLVVPKVHVLSLVHLPGTAQSDLLRLAFKVRQDLQAELSPDGFTIGMNDGEAAGQTVPHAHIHVIPRWVGDVPDPRGGIRWVLPEKAAYWVDQRKAQGDSPES
ncbi:MAG: HIT family protein [Gemmatimonadota bacterium]